MFLMCVGPDTSSNCPLGQCLNQLSRSRVVVIALFLFYSLYPFFVVLNVIFAVIIFFIINTISLVIYSKHSL